MHAAIVHDSATGDAAREAAGVSRVRRTHRRLALANALAWALMFLLVSHSQRPIVAAPSSWTALGAQETPTQTGRMSITIRFGEHIVKATLNEGAAARDFAALLPLRLTLKDYASTEKISDLPRRLSTAGAPPGFDPSIGDIAYYAPWGNLAIFYKDFRYSSGLISLGRVEAGLEHLADFESTPVLIERAD